MLNSATVCVWPTCYGRDLKQKFPFFSEDHMQNKDDLKNLCIDLSKILLRFTVSLYASLGCICLFDSPAKVTKLRVRAGSFHVYQSPISL